MHSNFRTAVFAAASAICLGSGATSARADEAADSIPAELSIHGFVSTSYGYNANRPDSKLNDYRVFDQNLESFTLDVVEIVVQQAPEEAGEAGFRFDLAAGSTIPRLSASSGLFRDDEGTAGNIDLQQAFVSAVLPVGKGLRVDAGKYLTHMGYELIEGFDGYNDQATRSFLFGYAIPFAHTGVKLSYPIDEKLGAALHLVNGWDNARDNNDAKSVGAQISILPADNASILLNYLGGAERTGEDSDLRHVFDFVGTFKPSNRLILGFNADYGTEAGAGTDGGDASWMGGALYCRAQMGPRFAICGRAEIFDDADGYRTGTEQVLKEITLTPEMRIGGGAVLRADLRYDISDEMVFTDRGDPASKDNQMTITLNAVASF